MPPILLMKRMLDDLSDSEEDYDDEPDEIPPKRPHDEPQPKRLRDASPDTNRGQNQSEKEAQEQWKSTKEAHRLVELLMPRIESQLQQLVNGAALRMLDVLGQKLSRLETRMEEMQSEWIKAAAGSTVNASEAMRQQHQRAAHFNFGHRHPSPVQQYFGCTQGQSVTPDTGSANGAPAEDDPMQSFLQEAAQAADTGIALPPSNRRAPFMARRAKPQSAPEFNAAIQAARGDVIPGNQELPPEGVPQVRLARGTESVIELWHEFFVGSADKPAINELDQKYGSAWRWKDSKEGVYYSMRRVVVDEIQSRVEARCPEATGATGDIWLSVCEEMDLERMASGSSLNQYISELKRREKVKSLPKVSRVYSPNDPYLPPHPCMSRTTASVQQLWTEWFLGKTNYNGCVNFPSIIHLNQRFGDSWRQQNTAEYNIYLKRRCIIDIALRRILEVGGEREDARKRVLKSMDAERVAHNLSLVQYHAWAREKYGYHAAVRTHIPKHFVDLGEGPEERFEQEYTVEAFEDELEIREAEIGMDAAVEEGAEAQDGPAAPLPASLNCG